MKVNIISIPVRDQQQALEFYTEKLGFIKKKDNDMGNGNRWLTVVSPEAQNGPEILLEPGPNHFEPCRVYQDELMKVGMPYTQFDVDDIDAEYNRLSKLGVQFSVEPKDMGTAKYAVFNDTCGNNIAIVQML